MTPVTLFLFRSYREAERAGFRNFKHPARPDWLAWCSGHDLRVLAGLRVSTVIEQDAVDMYDYDRKQIVALLDRERNGIWVRM